MSLPDSSFEQERPDETATPDHEEGAVAAPDDADTPDTAPLNAARVSDEPDAGEEPAGEEVEEAGEDSNGATTQLNPDMVPSLRVHYCRQGLSAAAMRDMGRVRETNQDSISSFLTHLPYENNDLLVGLFIVADGMGGHEGGEIASRLAIRVVVEQVWENFVLPMMQGEMGESLQAIMEAAVKQANRTIWDQAQASGSDMGTTCTAVLMLGQSLYIAHVGDSRLYLFDGTTLRLLTSDHSMVGRLIQLEYLDPAEAHNHPLRNQLYRTVGQQPDIEVDFIYESLGNATHMLLCSDGLWGMIDEEQIVQALTNSVWAQDICHELIALANLAGGEDNISAIVVTLPIMG